jgi:hypothetical protein
MGLFFGTAGIRLGAGAFAGFLYTGGDFFRG